MKKSITAKRNSLVRQVLVYFIVPSFAVLSLSIGCNQNRYEPAEWRALQKTELKQQLRSGTSLPGTSLPGTTLPGTTLPRGMRGTTLPGTTLPGRS